MSDLLNLLRKARDKKDRQEAGRIIAELFKGDKGEKGDSIKGDQGEPGRPGKDAPPVDEEAMEERLAERLKAPFVGQITSLFQDFRKSAYEYIDRKFLELSRKDTAEPNLDLATLESRLNEREKNLWNRIKELVAKAAQGAGSRGGGLSIHIGPTPPSNPSLNDLWIDTSG